MIRRFDLSYITSFFRREDGSVALETVILIPMLFWAYLALFSIFDTFRQYSIAQKTSFTIGDMVSRETAVIDNDYLDGLNDLFKYMTRSRGETALRVSSLRWNGNENRFETKFSEVRGTKLKKLTSEDVRNYADRLPLMKHNEHITLVETWLEHVPPFRTGLEKRDVTNFIFTRPRYAPEVKFEPN